MASLIVISSLFQFLLASRLSLLRRLFTPVVSGTVIMLIAVTVMPIVFDTLNDVPEGAAPIAAPAAALSTLIVVALLILRAPQSWRLWSPIIGIVVGCVVSVPFGLYDLQTIIEAPWVGVPFRSWPGLNLTPGLEFWALLPAFIIVTMVDAIETVGDGIAIQQVSRRRPRATDFRVVQGALNADGVGNLLSGLLGTLPNTTYSSSVSLAEVTGIAARHVGVVIGIIFAILAFFPKATALLIAIPAPVAAAYITVLLGLLFVQGMRMIIQDGIDHRKAAIVGLSFWISVGFQGQVIFPHLLGDLWGTLLSNGMTSGAIVAIGMMLFLNFTSPRRKRIEVGLNIDALPEVDRFVRGFASEGQWDTASTERLVAASEETIAILMEEAGDDFSESARRLAVSVRLQDESAELEFVTSFEGENMEDYLAYLSNLPPVADEHEVSSRLLLHYASSVRHQKYNNIDIITVNVEAGR